jgi:hypothetical protein
MNKIVTELALYDIANVVGVAADLSHCNTPVKVRWERLLSLAAAVQLALLFSRITPILHAGFWPHGPGGAAQCAQGR